MSPALLLALSLQAASPAQASASGPAASANGPASPDDDKKVCRREQVTGSHFPVTTCLTAGEWRRRDQQNQQDINQQRTLNGPH